MPNTQLIELKEKMESWAVFRWREWYLNTAPELAFLREKELKKYYQLSAEIRGYIADFRAYGLSELDLCQYLDFTEKRYLGRSSRHLHRGRSGESATSGNVSTRGSVAPERLDQGRLWVSAEEVCHATA